MLAASKSWLGVRPSDSSMTTVSWVEKRLKRDLMYSVGMRSEAMVLKRRAEAVKDAAAVKKDLGGGRESYENMAPVGRS